MPTILSLHIYPIKGMRGISLQYAELQPEGFKHDRRWMLVDDTGKFISQRTHLELTMFITSMDGDELGISYKGETIKINVNERSDEDIEVSVFDDVMRATVVSEQSSAWFSDRLQSSLRLVKVSPVTNRIKDYTKYINTASDKNETMVSFADGYPYLILGTASMTLLNSKMDVDLTIDRFRANIIVETGQPHAEDEWQTIQIGDQRMLVIKPCARCQVPTIDQLTGISGKQPNRALATYRRAGNKVNFGMNAVAMTDGIIKVGDRVI